MTQERGNILVVDDDRAMRTTLVANLEDQGHRLNACGSGKEAIGLIQQDAPDLVISDLRLPDLGGLDVLHALKEQRAEAAFILVTGYATVDTAVEALNEGAYAYITKPFNMDQVHSVIRNALLQQRLVRENRRLVASLQESNKELNTAVGQRKKAEEALQNSLERVRAAYEQSTIYAQELRDEIDQRTRAEAALVRSEELRRLQVAQEAKDQERKRLAEELHDETLAELTSFIVDLGLLSRSPAELPPDLRQILDELRERVRLAENGLRRIVQGLFPSVLTNLGLLPAIRSFMKEVADRPISNPTPVELELRATGLDGVRLPEEVEIAVYRVAQQGLVNALQHAHPRALLLELNWREDAPVSASTVARLKSKWNDELAQWRSRPLDDLEVVYMWVDGVYVKAGLEKEKAAVLVLMAALSDGSKVVVSAVPGYRESTENWSDVLRDMRRRGLECPRLVVGDGHLGIWGALRNVYPQAAEQRCWNHKIVNVLAKLPKRQQDQAKLMLRTIPYAPTRTETERLRTVFTRWCGDHSYEAASEALERDWDRMVTFYDFPKEHWGHLRTTNPVESPFAALRLRTDAAKRYKRVDRAIAVIWKMLMSPNSASGV